MGLRKRIVFGIFAIKIEYFESFWYSASYILVVTWFEEKPLETSNLIWRKTAGNLTSTSCVDLKFLAFFVKQSRGQDARIIYNTSLYVRDSHTLNIFLTFCWKQNCPRGRRGILTMCHHNLVSLYICTYFTLNKKSFQTLSIEH